MSADDWGVPAASDWGMDVNGWGAADSSREGQGAFAFGDLDAALDGLASSAFAEGSTQGRNSLTSSAPSAHSQSAALAPSHGSLLPEFYIVAAEEPKKVVYHAFVLGADFA